VHRLDVAGADNLMNAKKPHERVCGAKTKSGGRCNRIPAEGKKRCRFHGGAPGSGRPCITGKYSTVRANQLAAKMREAETDPQLFNQQRRTAFLEGLWQEAVEQMLSVAEDEPAHLWRAAIRHLEALKVAILSGKASRVRAALSNLEGVLKNGRAVDAAEERARVLLQEIASVSMVQYKGVKTAQEVLTAQEQQLFEARFIHAVRNESRLSQEAKRIVAALVLRAAGAEDR
jgi:hypothetical protein